MTGSYIHILDTTKLFKRHMTKLKALGKPCIAFQCFERVKKKGRLSCGSKKLTRRKLNFVFLKRMLKVSISIINVKIYGGRLVD